MRELNNKVYIAESLPDAHLSGILKEAVASITQGLIVTEGRSLSEEPRILIANQAMVNLTGYSGQELLSGTPALYKPVSRHYLTYTDERVIAVTGTSYTCETAIRTKMQIELWVELTVSVIVQNSRIAHYVYLHRDLTQQKQVEHELATLRKKEISDLRKISTQADSLCA